jgi:hypothetical protein
MKTVFTLGESRKNADTLIMEVGPDYCSYAFLDTISKSFDLIRYIVFDEVESEQELKNLLDQLEESFERVRICSAFEQALITPQHLFKGNYALLDLVFDNGSRYHMNDPINEWQVTALYSMPSLIYKILLSKFPFAEFCHSYTPALKIYNGFVAPDQVDIHFTTSNFRVIVKKDGGLQLAQTYSYKTPLDVVYYLLKIFYEFRLDQSEAFLIVSGLVEQDSTLYNELHHYFANIHFSQAPAFSIPGDAHPQYYFTSLYNLAACVS